MFSALRGQLQWFGYAADTVERIGCIIIEDMQPDLH